jgi:hypothetical protein
MSFNKVFETAVGVALGTVLAAYLGKALKV